MTTPAEDLRAAAAELIACSRKLSEPEIVEPIAALEEAITDAAKAWSGSWFGYHANVYYEHMKRPPPGAHFSSEWGLDDAGGMGTNGQWAEYDADTAKEMILVRALQPDLNPARRAAAEAAGLFDEAKARVISILAIEKSQREDTFVAKLLDDATNANLIQAARVIDHWRPSGTLMSRDSIAMSQGLWTPPHLALYADVIALKSSKAACELLAGVANKAASHLERAERSRTRAARVGTNIFIGHGRSLLWKDLKDFLQDRLRLPWDEFNRVPVAGVTNIARLAEMLDAAALAFVVLTAEDETKDGTVRARMNVVHEAGLFQGRLGFTRAILLLEDGCEEFSNIQGLGQIRFPKGNIKAAFEEVRQVLEREAILETAGKADT